MKRPTLSARVAPSLSVVVSDPVPERVSQPDESVSDAQRAALRAKWRRQKKAQRAKDQLAAQKKRRAYYAKNRAKLLAYSHRYHFEVRKLRDAGVIP